MRTPGGERHGWRQRLPQAVPGRADRAPQAGRAQRRQADPANDRHGALVPERIRAAHVIGGVAGGAGIHQRQRQREQQARRPGRAAHRQHRSQQQAQHQPGQQVEQRRAAACEHPVHADRAC